MDPYALILNCTFGIIGLTLIGKGIHLYRERILTIRLAVVLLTTFALFPLSIWSMEENRRGNTGPLSSLVAFYPILLLTVGDTVDLFGSILRKLSSRAKSGPSE